MVDEQIAVTHQLLWGLVYHRAVRFIHRTHTGPTQSLSHISVPHWYSRWHARLLPCLLSKAWYSLA